MTPTYTPASKSTAPSNPFSVVAAFVGWVIAADRSFRNTQAMIDAPGIHF
jgi:hypothetical protein